MNYHAQLFQAKDGWRVRTVAQNNRKGAVTEAYTHRLDAICAWRCWFPWLNLFARLKPRTPWTQIRTASWKLTFLGSFLLWATIASAQVPVVNPTTIEFDASADHNAVVLGTTTPLVTKYVLRLFLENASSPISGDVDLGKPVPVAGKITLTNRQWFVAAAMNLRHIAKVAAVGPTGEGVSDPSGPFGNVGPPAKPGAPVIRP